MCNEESKLQSLIDGEFEGNKKDLLLHIDSCLDCSNTYKKLLSQEDLISNSLNQMIKIPPINEFNTDFEKNKFTWRFFEMKNVRRFASMAAIVGVVGSVFLFDPIRAAAEDILRMFRVDKVQGVAFNESDLRELGDVFSKGDGFKDIENIGSIKVDSNGKESISLDNPSFEDIKAEMKDLKIIKAPKDMTYYQFQSEPASKITMALDVKTLNEFLSFLGEQTLLPQSLDKKEFSINLDDVVSYSLDKKEDSIRKSIGVMQFKTPNIEVPKDVNVEEIIEVLTKLDFIPDDIKKQLSSLTNADTIPVPYYEEEQNMEKKIIAGMDATIISQKNPTEYDYNVIILNSADTFMIINTNMDLSEVEKLISEME